MATKIFYIDRFVDFSTKIFDDLQTIILKEKNYEISFIGPYSYKSENWLSSHEVKNARRVWHYGHYVKSLYNYIIKEKPNIVHFLFEWRVFGPLTASIKFPFLLFLLRFKTQAKIIVDLRAPLIAKHDNQWKIMKDIIPLKIPGPLLKIFLKIFIKLVCVLSHKIIVDSAINKLGFIEFYGINEEKIDVIELVISPNKINIKQQTRKKYEEQFKDKRIILCFGVISPRKSYDTIINEFAKLITKIPDHILIIAGPTLDDAKSYESKLHNLVKKLNLESKVFFLGYLNQEDIEIIFDMAEFVLYIYRPTAGSSGAIFNALHHSKPCILSKSETFLEIMSEDDALFIDYGNANQLSEAIITMASNQTLRLELQNRTQSVIKNLLKKPSAIKYFDLYKSIVK